MAPHYLLTKKPDLRRFFLFLKSAKQGSERCVYLQSKHQCIIDVLPGKPKNKGHTTFSKCALSLKPQNTDTSELQFITHSLQELVAGGALGKQMIP
jgi:hypothetical protein